MSILLADTYFDKASHLHKFKGEFELALRFYKKAAKLYEDEILSNNNVGIMQKYTTIINDWGEVYLAQNKIKEALALQIKSLDIRNEILPEKSVEFADSYNGIGISIGKLGFLNEALELFDKSIVIYQENLGENHYYNAVAIHNKSWIFYLKEDYEKAIRLIDKSLSILAKNKNDFYSDRFTFPMVEIKFIISYFNDYTMERKLYTSFLENK